MEELNSEYKHNYQILKSLYCLFSFILILKLCYFL